MLKVFTVEWTSVEILVFGYSFDSFYNKISSIFIDFTYRLTPEEQKSSWNMHVVLVPVFPVTVEGWMVSHPSLLRPLPKSSQMPYFFRGYHPPYGCNQSLRAGLILKNLGLCSVKCLFIGLKVTEVLEVFPFCPLCHDRQIRLNRSKTLPVQTATFILFFPHKRLKRWSLRTGKGCTWDKGYTVGIL